MSLSQLAEIAEEIKSPQDTILVLQTLLQYKPKTLDARRLLRTIEVEMWEERNEKKFNPLSKIRTEAISLKVIPVLSQAEKAKAENKPEEVLDLMERVLEASPCHERANLLMADAAQLMGDPATMAFAYEMICYEQPDNLHYLHLLAEAYVKAADYHAACDTYRRILESAPDDRDAIQGLKAASACLQPALSGGGESVPSWPLQEPAAENTASGPGGDPAAGIDPVALESHLQQIDERIEQLQPSGSSTAEQLEEWEHLQRDRKYYALQLAYHQASHQPDDHRLALALAGAYVENRMFPEAMQVYESMMADPDLRIDCYRGMSVCFIRQMEYEQMVQMGEYGDFPSEQPAAMRPA